MTPLIRSVTLLSAGFVLGFLVSRYLEHSLPGEPVANPQPKDSRFTFTEPQRSPSSAAKSAPKTRYQPPAEPSSTPENLEQILTISGDFGQSAALYDLAARADVEELKVLLAQARNLGQLSERRAATSILYGRFGELDPEAAIDHILETQDAMLARWLDTVFYSWSREDLTGALTKALSLNLQEKRRAGSAILRARDDLSNPDRERLAEELGLKDLLRQLNLQEQYVQARDDPASAWAKAMADPSQLPNRSTLYNISTAWGQQDPLAALNALADLKSPQLRLEMQQQVIAAWSASEPNQAIAWLLQQDTSTAQADMLAQSLAVMAQSQPREALEIASTLPALARTKSVTQVIQQWADTDPRSAAAWYDALPEGEAKGEWVHQIAFQYGLKHPREAIRWLNGLNTADTANATASLFNTLARRNATLASELIDEISDESARANASHSLVQTWARNDPEAAIDWAQAIDSPAARRRAISSAIGQWAGIDRDAALDYVQQLDTRLARENAILSILNQSYNDPEFAESLYPRIQDPNLKRRAANALYSILRRQNSERAERYRSTAGIPKTTGNGG